MSERDDLLAEVRALRAEIRAALGMDRPGRLVHAISAATGGLDFNSAELLARAIQVPELRDAILEQLSPRSLGRILQRLEGRSFGAFRLERIGSDRCGAIWLLRHDDE